MPGTKRGDSMKILKRKQKVQTAPPEALAGPGGRNILPWEGTAAQGAMERRLYEQLRARVPIIDSAIGKLRRLIGSFTVECEDPDTTRALEKFLRRVPVNAAETGIEAFIGNHFEQLLTYGNAVGEIVPGEGGIAALYNAAPEAVEIEEPAPLQVRVSRREADGTLTPCRLPQLVVVSALNPIPGSARGVSLLRGLPFVSEILMGIYHAIGVNWERAGNVRFAVTCKDDNPAFAGEKAKRMAEQWQQAMRSGTVNDFVAVGDVSSRAIGADNQVLDSEGPVRQMLEQIIARLGVPPFLLGLSWSSTERMSSQQADILTSELEAYRRLLDPVIEKVAGLWLRMQGLEDTCRVVWDEITMQDEVDHANARLQHARAAEIEAGLARPATEEKEEGE